MKKKDSSQPEVTKGLFGKYESNTPAPVGTSKKLTWFSNFAPFGIQFRWFFFVIVLIVILVLSIPYLYDPFADNREDLFKSIELLNKAILLTDQQGTGDYFTYWDEDILTMFKEGLDLSSLVGHELFQAKTELASMEQPDFDSLVWGANEAYHGYIQSHETGETPGETRLNKARGLSTMLWAKRQVAEWIDYWNKHGETIKETFNLTIDASFYVNNK